ncbi:MAG: hypothetical protein ACLT8E_08215 [Akkermansia sp.]
MMGFRAILLYGDPDYYSRHGFMAETLGIEQRMTCTRHPPGLRTAGRGLIRHDRYVEAPCMILMKVRPLTCIFRQGDGLRTPSQKRFEKLPPCGEKRMREPETGNPCTLRMS